MDRKPLRNQWVIPPWAGLLAISLFAALLFAPFDAHAGRTRQITFGYTWGLEASAPNYSAGDQGAQPAFISPDGSYLAFYRSYVILAYDYGIDGGDKFLIRTDGSGMYSPFTGLPHNTYFGNFNWDGSIVVFSDTGNFLGTNPNKVFQIFSMNQDSGELKQLTFSDVCVQYSGSNCVQYSGNGSPRVSADGTWIVFASNDDFVGTNPEHDSELFAVNFDGTEYIQITDNSRPDSLPYASSWASLDLDVIVFEGKPGTTWNYYLTDFSGSFETLLTRQQYVGWPISVAGNGSLIAFSTNGSPRKLFTVRPDGTGEKLIGSNSDSIRGYLNGDGKILMKVEGATGCCNYPVNIFVGPSDGSAFKKINPSSHGFVTASSADLTYSGKRAVFSMTSSYSPLPNETRISSELFIYDDDIGTTPVGKKVAVKLDEDAKVTFDRVASSGETSVLISQVGLNAPEGSGIYFGYRPLHYEISTTVAWSGNAEVCLGYGDRSSRTLRGTPIKLWRRDGNAWTDITASVDDKRKVVCGATDRLGEFVVAMFKVRDHYVITTDGNDSSGDGSKNKPWASIGHAVDILDPDAAAPLTIHVGEGTYAEQVKMKDYLTFAGSYNHNWRQRSVDRWPSIIRPPGRNIVETGVIGARNSTFDGFKIDGLSYGMYIYNCSPTVSNCRIINNAYGLYVVAMRFDSQVASPVIKNNVIALNDTGIISTAELPFWMQGCGIGCTYDWMDYSTIVEPSLVNNTVVSNKLGTWGVTIGRNNIYWNNEHDFCPPSPFMTTEECAFFTYTDSEDGLAGASNINADPMFVDATAGNYRLLPGSPAIDAGDPDPQYNDLDGSRNDMGAYGGPGAMLTVAKVKLPNGIQIDDIPEAMPGGEYFTPAASNTGQGGCSYAGRSMNGMMLGDFLVYMALIIFPLFIMRSIRSVRRQARKFA